jgi:hypothetical protein
VRALSSSTVDGTQVMRSRGQGRIRKIARVGSYSRFAAVARRRTRAGRENGAGTPTGREVRPTTALGCRPGYRGLSLPGYTVGLRAALVQRLAGPGCILPRTTWYTPLDERGSTTRESAVARRSAGPLLAVSEGVGPVVPAAPEPPPEPPDLEEAEAVSRVQGGDVEAFDLLVRRYMRQA